MFSPPVQETQIIPDIAPMRRGRPAKPTSQHNSTKPSPSPFRGPSADPFAALDGGRARSRNTDELSHRFPTLDQFQILHETGGKFDFEPAVAAESKPEDEDLARRLTNALADDAFVKRREPVREPAIQSKGPPGSSVDTKPRESPRPPEERSQQQTPLYQPIPKKPTMVSTGTMTSPPATPGVPEIKTSNRSVYKYAPQESDRQPSSQPRTAENKRKKFGQINNNNTNSNNSNINNHHDVLSSHITASFKTQPAPRPSSEGISHVPASSRPSLEGLRPSHAEIDPSVVRSKSVISRTRPLSVYATSKHDFPDRVESARASLDLPRPKYDGGAMLKPVRSDIGREYDPSNISSDVDYLRAKEEEMHRKREKRAGTSAKHTKRPSLSKSIPGTKLLTSRFGDAFRRFESHGSDHKHRHALPPADKPAQMTLITNSEVMQSSEDALDDADEDDADISPEMRRELERRRLSQEEKRVASAAAEYRRLVAERGQGRWKAGTDNPRSPAIQSKMQSLLQENNRVPSTRTASGYGRYTDSNTTALQAKPSESRPEQNPSTSRTAGSAYGTRNGRASPSRENRDERGISSGVPSQHPTQTGRVASAFSQPQRTGSRPVPPPRPVAPPKPKNLRVGTTQDISPPSSRESDGALKSPANVDDWESSFSRRFPSLSRLEMVETEIEVPRMSSLRTKEV